MTRVAVRPAVPAAPHADTSQAAASHYDRIYAVVKQIPRGRVATYGQIAALAGLPGHARQVGYALHATPSGQSLPWHRVINAQGAISLPPREGGDVQRAMLKAERIKVGADGIVDLVRYQWRPRSRVAMRLEDPVE